MNTLSWFIYLADVIPSFGGFILTIGGLVLFAGIALVVCYAFDNDGKPPKYWQWITIAPLVLMLIGLFIPSKNTMYAIAASELGEKVIRSEIGEKSFKALSIWLDKQIGEK
jgi:hypothetical protein